MVTNMISLDIHGFGWSAILFSIVPLLGRFSYQLPTSGPSVPVIFVLATKLGLSSIYMKE